MIAHFRLLFFFFAFPCLCPTFNSTLFIQPANLLIDAAGSIRVADFGLATLRRPAAVAAANAPHKTAERSASSARGASASRGASADAVDEPFVDLTGLTGSFRFMAPEVYCEKPYGRPVDVYSFAMIAYNILESRLDV